MDSLSVMDAGIAVAYIPQIMKGRVLYMNRQKIFLQGIIDNINRNIEILKSANVEIHDADDFDFAIDYVRYSEASDSVTFYTRQADSEDEEDFEERKEWHEEEIRNAS